MGIWALLATVVPLGIGAAFTPSLLALQVLVVSGDPWHRRSLAVALGSASAFVFVGAMFFLGFSRLNVGTSLSSDVGIALRAIIGVGLLAFAVWLFRPHPKLRDRVEQDINAYAARASSWVFLGIAFALSIKDVSSFAMLLPALHDIAVADVPILVQAGMLILLYALALAPVLVPPVLRLFFDHRVDGFLQAVYRFTMAHQFPIVGAMCAIIGVYLLASAVLIGIGR